VDDIRHETERLVLRMYRLSDFEDHYKLSSLGTDTTRSKRKRPLIYGIERPKR
jgi:hypothetical protein